MKRILSAMLFLILLPSLACAYSMTIEWNYSDADMAKITSFKVKNAVTKASVATVAKPLKTATLEGLSGATSFYVTAVDSYGVESAPSNTVSYGGLPSAPSSATIKVIVEVTVP